MTHDQIQSFIAAAWFSGSGLFAIAFALFIGGRG